MADSSEVDEALIAYLAGDSQLSGLLTDGVYVDVSPAGRTRFCLVSQVFHEDETGFDGRIFETFTYLVKAVDKSSSGATVKTAAARIDTLLEDVPLTITGYNHLKTQRTERVRYTEVDALDPDIRWQHRGGRYEVIVAPVTAGSPGGGMGA